MPSIIGNTNESVAVGEARNKLITTHNFGVAGTNPLSDYAQRINVLLCDAIKAKWDDTLYGVDEDPSPGFPSVANNDLIFLNTWFTGSKDIELIFKEALDDKPALMRSTDWRYQGHITTVDIHAFVRGAGGDVEPEDVGAVNRALETIIALNHTTLIPNAVVNVAFSQPAPTENQDDFQTLWHTLMKVRVQYFKVRTV